MTTKYLKPLYDGPRRRFKLSQILAYEAALAGIPAPQLDPADDRLLSAQELCRRHGISEMTLWRRLRQQEADDAAAT